VKGKAGRPIDALMALAIAWSRAESSPAGGGGFEW
jgi:hypothetical protein